MIEITEKCLLVSKGGAQIVRYAGNEQFGRIQHDGIWYEAKRLHDGDMPVGVYIEGGTATLKSHRDQL